MKSLSGGVTIFEVGPRDGLQNEKTIVSTEQKHIFLKGLVAAGIQELEIGAFVRPDRIPQMADTDALYSSLKEGTLSLGKARPWSLLANQKGLERALQVGAKNIALFTGVTDSFTQKNIGMTVEESLQEFSGIIKEAKKQKLFVRCYLSTAFGCPYEGVVPAKKTLKVIEKISKLGVFQISVGDTIGVATPKDVDAVVKPALKHFGVKKIALHFHDTRGTALANAYRSLELGVRNLDSSAGGLGGCPYAPGASGNLATEDLVYLLHGLGMKTGINLDLLCKTSLDLARVMKRALPSKTLQAFAAKCTT